MWIRIAIIGVIFLIVVWLVTKPWREKHNVKIEYKQLFLKLRSALDKLITSFID